MDAKQFFHLVEKMRNKQREYAITKREQSRKEAKLLEQMVDAEIYRVNTIINERMNPQLNFDQ